MHVYPNVLLSPTSHKCKCVHYVFKAACLFVYRKFVNLCASQDYRNH